MKIGSQASTCDDPIGCVTKPDAQPGAKSDGARRGSASARRRRGRRARRRGPSRRGGRRGRFPRVSRSVTSLWVGCPPSRRWRRSPRPPRRSERLASFDLLRLRRWDADRRRGDGCPCSEDRGAGAIAAGGTSTASATTDAASSREDQTDQIPPVQNH
eukprot:gene17585-biopygen4701